VAVRPGRRDKERTATLGAMFRPSHRLMQFSFIEPCFPVTKALGTMQVDFAVHVPGGFKVDGRFVASGAG
jgi:hypothetical protein